MVRFSITETELRQRIDEEAPGWHSKAQAQTAKITAAGTLSRFPNLWSEIKQVYMTLQGSKCAFCEKWLEDEESADFLKGDYWRLRGKLDVPKERWVSFPNCEGPDGTLVVAWAGYDHLQLARAVSAYYVDVQERLGGRDDPRLVPLLACLIELLPWLKQWHNEIDPEFGVPMGDYFEGFIQEEARQLGKTVPEIKAWKPPQRTARRPRASGAGTRSTTRRRTEALDSPEE